MKTPNAAEVKKTLKDKGVKVLRAITYRGYVILTVADVNASLTESVLAELNIMQQHGPRNPIRSAKANMLGYVKAAEFTGLVQL